MKSLAELRRAIQQAEGRRAAVMDQVRLHSKALAAAKSAAEDCRAAQVLIQQISKAVQARLQAHVSHVVTAALRAVFPAGYEAKLEFVLRRGRTEAEFSFMRDGHPIDPMTESGGGPVDVAAFALRVAMWRLSDPAVTRNTLLLDEPFRFVSREYREAVAEMISTVSRELKLQILMVTHDPVLVGKADRVFHVEMKDGASHVWTESTEVKPTTKIIRRSPRHE